MLYFKVRILEVVVVLVDMSSFSCAFDFETLIKFLVVREFISAQLQIRSDPDLQFVSLLSGIQLNFSRKILF